MKKQAYNEREPLIRDETMTTPVCLTIAGSDSGGGAGIQADLKAFAAFGVHGASAITCVTAQNPGTVSGVSPLDADFIKMQVNTVCDFFPVAAVKTGMVYSSSIIESVAEAIKESGVKKIVVDPVMVATSGSRLLSEEALRALQETLLGLATVVTPNVDEAEILLKRPISNLEDMEMAAKDISDRFQVDCVVKGGHEREGTGTTAVDILCVDGAIQRFTEPRSLQVDSHGSGCAFASAIAACLALDMSVAESVAAAKEYIQKAIHSGRRIGDKIFLAL